MGLSLIWPVAALVGLTCAVWFVLYARRIPFMLREKIAPGAVASRVKATELLAPVSAPADNFANLLELPVLFYVLAIVATLTGRTGEAMAAAAWAFVTLRVVHSLIHCTYNRVTHRFLVYAAGALVLWGMWAAWAISMLR